MIDRDFLHFALLALLAAALTGASAPLKQLPLPDVEPLLLATLLYLASGLGLARTHRPDTQHRRERDSRAGPARRTYRPDPHHRHPR